MGEAIRETIICLVLGGLFYFFVLNPWLSIPDISKSINDLKKSVDALIKEIERSRRDG